MLEKLLWGGLMLGAIWWSLVAAAHVWDDWQQGIFTVLLSGNLLFGAILVGVVVTCANRLRSIKSRE